MNAVIFKSNDKKSLKLLQEIAKKMNVQFNELTSNEVDDLELALQIEAGMRTKNVSRKAVMNALGHDR
jgi:hypothetical protein